MSGLNAYNEEQSRINENVERIQHMVDTLQRQRSNTAKYSQRGLVGGLNATIAACSDLIEIVLQGNDLTP